jgi:hypothetical protein
MNNNIKTIVISQGDTFSIPVLITENGLPKDNTGFTSEFIGKYEDSGNTIELHKVINSIDNSPIVFNFTHEESSQLIPGFLVCNIIVSNDTYRKTSDRFHINIIQPI